MYNQDYSGPTVTNCTFSGNYVSRYNGGGMQNCYRSDPTVSNCTFLDNSAEYYGGGICNQHSGNPQVTNCTFVGNYARYHGGGMYNSFGSNPTAGNCTFIANSASNGGGMFNYNNSSPTVTNCTFADNSALASGGGMGNNDSSPSVTNCILYSDGPDEIRNYGSSNPLVIYSCVEGGWLGEANIESDPLFADQANGDYHLTPGSPCIDTGTNSPPGGLSVTDLDGNPRCVDGDGDSIAVVDMGAYEAEHVPSNTLPEILAIHAPLEPVQVNTVVAVGASFADADLDDTHTAEWDWGDETWSEGSVDEEEKTVSGDHTYEAAGVYTVTLTVTDEADESDTATYEYIVVYDPAAGFVTGGGWIDSPAGACVLDPEVSGKANFGFVSKYKKGATVPTGNTEFQFKAGGLDFHSTSYDWLVITGSDYARFKGTGTINGSGEYKFMLWADDSDPDTFRIKIWEEDEFGTETVIYDNSMDQPIGGGNIVVHAK